MIDRLERMWVTSVAHPIAISIRGIARGVEAWVQQVDQTIAILVVAHDAYAVTAVRIGCGEPDPTARGHEQEPSAHR